MLESKVIFSSLIYNDDYMRKCIPFLKDEYFKENEEKALFKLIQRHINKYNQRPSKESLLIDLSNISTISENVYNNTKNLLEELSNGPYETRWLVDVTEGFCKERAIHNALLQAISIMEDDNGELDKGSIPGLLQDALGVSFDTTIGHDYLENAEERYEYYHRKEEKIEFDIDYLNKITDGGVSKKTLSIVMAPSGVGKSVFLCHFAAENLYQGKNVLYITLEMSEEKISERIDANLMNIPIKEVKHMSKTNFDSKINKIKNKTRGKLIVKEYPTASASVAHFRHLLNELKLKKKFIPDIIYIDYLNICASSRIRSNGNSNSYTIVKSIAEEIRGLAIEFEVPIWSATQINRDGYSNSDPDMSNVSESMGLVHTADLLFSLVTNEDLATQKQIMIKQLKNRYSSINDPSRFIIGLDLDKMRLYNVENDIGKDEAIFDKTNTSERISQEKFDSFQF